jgi:hypothetical protein
MRVIALIEDPAVVRAILTHLGLWQPQALERAPPAPGMATLFGMAPGGWMSGAIFDLSGSYRAAFANGIGWNLLNLSIAFWLLRRDWARKVLVPA